MNGGHALPSSSAWPAVFLILGAGVVSAFQVGKAPLALSAVQDELGLSLATASWLNSAFALIGAVAGAPIGLAVDRIGAKRMAVAGLLLMAAGSALGAVASGPAVLLGTRVIEGLGFLGLIVAAPVMVVAVAPLEIRDRAMALWASFMPVGMTIVLLAAPLLSLLTWRGFWTLNAVILFGYAALLALTLELPPSRRDRHPPIRQDIGSALRAPGPWILGGLFAAFATGFFALFGFLPSYLSERLGIGLEAASLLSAAAIAASGLGNLACGQLLARGARPVRLLAASFGILAICGAGAFAAPVPGAAVVALCVVFAFASGLVPVVIFFSAPLYAPTPALVGATLGFAMQGNNVGLLLGPAASGAIAAAFGWPAVSLLIAAICLLAALPIVAYRVFGRRRSGQGAGGPAGAFGGAVRKPSGAGSEALGLGRRSGAPGCRR